VPYTDSRPRLYFEAQGGGEPMLLITGFGLGCALLEPLLSAAPAGVRWIVYDHPGIGRSDRRGCSYTTGGLAAGALRVLDQLELPSAHIAGMSLGGAVAIELALRAPERVRSLVLMGTTAGGPLERHLDIAALAVASARSVTGSLTRRRLWFGPTIYSQDHLHRPTTPRPHAPVRGIGASPIALVGQACAASLHDRSRSLRKIEAPTLVMHGADDALLPVANARALAAGIPDCALRILPRAGHAFALERPDEVAAVLTEWAMHGRLLAT
jgi:pimeloyl-ACP methyl ester carboxylesterase